MSPATVNRYQIGPFGIVAVLHSNLLETADMSPLSRDDLGEIIFFSGNFYTTSPSVHQSIVTNLM